MISHSRLSSAVRSVLDVASRKRNRRFPSERSSAGRLGICAAALALAVSALLAPTASASPPPSGPVFRLDALANTTAAPGGQLLYLVNLTNQGASDGSGPVALEAKLPAGLTADHVDFSAGSFTCHDGSGGPVLGASLIRCTSSNSLSRLQFVSLSVWINVAGAASGTKTTTFEAYGGGATLAGGGLCASAATPPPALPPCVSTPDPTTISASPPPFGIDAFDGQVAADPDGSPYTQAGGTPYSASTSFDITTRQDTVADQAFNTPGAGMGTPTESPKDALVHLPPGLVGNPSGVAQCTVAQLTATLAFLPTCPPESQIGTIAVRTNFGLFFSTRFAPLYNMVPPADVPARLGFNVLGANVILDAHLRSGSDYGLDISGRGISQGITVAGSTVTIWGVPSDPSHNNERACPGQSQFGPSGWGCTSSAPPSAFLRLPTSCQGPLTTTLHGDSWAHPGAQDALGNPVLSDPNWKQASFVSHNPPGYPNLPSQWGSPQGVTGCGQVPFSPSISVQPTSSAADSPTGLDVNLHLPQTTDPTQLAEADLKKAVVTLPQGMAVNPSAADGLGACTSAQANLASDGPASCPSSSKVGTVQITTPLLPDPLDGSVYLAKQQDNPFNSLLSIYIVAQAQGVNVKLPGKIEPDPATGQLKATFDNQPQLPFSDLHLSFFGGDRATLTTPPTCGQKTVEAALSPWSQPTSPVSHGDSFQITSGPNGSPCPADAAHRPSAPTMSAGTTDPTAGHYSPFVLRLQRSPGSQEVTSLQADLPPGLVGKLAGVAQCSDATLAAIPTAIGTGQGEINNPSCPANSQIGYARIGTGSGAPFYVNTGKVYLAGPYKGAPFSVAIVTPAVAGPFDLGNVVVRSTLNVDKDDAQVHVTSDPIPTILQGIPLDIRDIRVVLDRQNFTLNPTNCNPMAITADATSTEGMVAHLSDRFQVGECANLAFKPSFTVSTAGKTSKANGASLHVHLGTHEGPTNGGAPGESNIAKVDVQLPVVLPARLPTLQKACTAAQFATDPAGCPVGSFVGTAIAHTPILASPLSGPAILVSHGGQAFPDLVLVLQGEGVRLNITGHTQIKKGITFSHFETVPDAPVSSFDLTLPQGPHAVLTTDIPGRNLCTHTKTVTVTKRVTRRVHGHTRRVTVKAKKTVAAPLLMPTTITAQNGAVIHQNTKIAVTGCAKTRPGKARRATRGHR